MEVAVRVRRWCRVGHGMMVRVVVVVVVVVEWG